MSKIKVADFYYGAVLSMLFSHNIKPALIENGNDRQVYDFTTNKTKFTLFVKYRSEKVATKKKDYNSWSFFIANDLDEMNKYLDNEKNPILALVCGSDNLNESELAILDGNDIGVLNYYNKKTISISRKKGEKQFRIAIDGSRENAHLIKTNRFEELFG
jgi:hypothetical protein